MRKIRNNSYNPQIEYKQRDMNKDGTTGDIDKQRDMMSTWIISTTTCK